MAVPADWCAAPTAPRSSEQEIHIWRGCLDIDRNTLGRLESTLATDELTRASRFVFSRDRDRFVAGRGILRDILGRYLDCPSSTVGFTYEHAGKPVLALCHSPSPVRFNLSHSQDVAVFAISVNRVVGVDIEAVRTDIARDDVADRCFSIGERVELRSLPPEWQDEGFFLGWTRKEAYVKALGLGLGAPLDGFDVSLTPGLPERLVSPDFRRWILRSFCPADGYVGAVVAEGQELQFRFWDWNLTRA